MFTSSLDTLNLHIFPQSSFTCSISEVLTHPVVPPALPRRRHLRPRPWPGTVDESNAPRQTLPHTHLQDPKGVPKGPKPGAFKVKAIPKPREMLQDERTVWSSFVCLGFGEGLEDM